MVFVMTNATRKLVDDLNKKTGKDMDSRKEIILAVPVIMTQSKTTSENQRPASQQYSPSGEPCRICQEDEGCEKLISPCHCLGTVRSVHASCLEKWLSSSNTTRCELCKYQYTVTRQAKTMKQWLNSSNCRNGPTGFYGDIFCLILLTPLCVGSVYLCAVGARVYIKHGLWEGTGLAVLCCFLMAVYILWCFVTIRFHWRRLKRWQLTNQNVHLIIQDCYRDNDHRVEVLSCSNKTNEVQISYIDESTTTTTRSNNNNIELTNIT